MCEHDWKKRIRKKKLKQKKIKKQVHSRRFGRFLLSLVLPPLIATTTTHPEPNIIMKFRVKMLDEIHI